MKKKSEVKFIPVRIRKDRCKGCGLCVDVCPRQLIFISDDEINPKGYHPAKYDETRGECIYCMQCALMCPEVAIEIVRLEEE